jgi:hypothetical protein
MQKFEDVLRRFERRELSAVEAGEMLGVSERQFLRYRQRYDEAGLAGLVDRRLGKASVKRVPLDKIVWMLGQYRTHHMGWNVKHFHEHLRRLSPAAARLRVGLHLDQAAVACGGACRPGHPARAAPAQAAAQAVRRHDAASGRQPVCVARRVAGTRSHRDAGRCHQQDLFGQLCRAFVLRRDFAGRAEHPQCRCTRDKRQRDLAFPPEHTQGAGSRSGTAYRSMKRFVASEIVSSAS